MTDWFGVALGLIAVACMLLPSAYEPTIRLKEWFDEWDRPEEDDT
jgi:hypothetical protein